MGSDIKAKACARQEKHKHQRRKKNVFEIHIITNLFQHLVSAAQESLHGQACLQGG